MNEGRRFWIVSTLSRGKENIQKIWYKVKKNDLSKIEYVWTDQTSKLYIDKYNEIELIINEIVGKLDEIIEIINQKKEGENIENGNIQ